MSITPPLTQVGPYRLVRRIGQGGMAEVFLAVSTSPVGDVHKLVVIKRVRETLRDDADFIRMFLDEARISARINHPNVVHTYAVEVEDGVPLIVMEYLDGVPLQAIAKRLSDRPWQERLPLVWALTQALGSGGMGHVFKALDWERRDLPEGDRHVAIKILRQDGERGGRQLADLRREFYCAQALAHPNIVKVYETGQDGDLVFFTMELLEGESLRELMQRHSPHGLPRSRVWELIRDIGAGVAQ